MKLGSDSIHQFFEDPKVVVVPELICDFSRTAKVYKNEVIGGYFSGVVLSIQVKLSIETLLKPLAVSVEAQSLSTTMKMN